MVRDRFRKTFEALEADVLKMGDLAHSMLKDGLAALVDLDAERAEIVAARTDKLADMDETIEHEILQFMTLQSPVAGDLRRIGAALKLITYLNRVGRYAYDIAKVVKAWPEGTGHLSDTIGLEDMGEKVEHMLDLTLGAYRVHEDVDTVTVGALEDDVDGLRVTVFRDALVHMLSNTANIERGAHTMMVARYLERCGDNIVKMAEKQHYAVTGERLLLR
jgi:phosphate transport system protein